MGLVGLEPTTFQLRADYSTIELQSHKSPQRGFEPATIAYKAIVLTTKTMGALFELSGISR